MSGRLVCRGGELAGSRFELGADTAIGRDAGGRLTVSSSELPAAIAHLREVGGDMCIEAAPGAGVQVDGTALSGRMKLGRMNVISAAGVDFVFSAGAPAQAAPPRPAALPPEPAPPAPVPPQAAPSAPAKPGPPAAPDASHTVVDMAGFGALPELSRGQQDSGTVVDMAGFGALPELSRAPAPQAPPPPPATAQPQPAMPEPEPDPGATVQMPAVAYELSMQQPGRPAATFMLRQGDNIIGRGADADVRIEDPEMWLSRRHANVRVIADSVELLDLQARNGTFVAGSRIDRAPLKSGSTFVLGPHFQFTLQQR